MPSCELCGRKDAMYDCEIEGTMMKVCEDCTKFGKVKAKSSARIVVQESRKIESKEPVYVFVPGYGLIVKNAREKLGLKQEDFAKKINEHKSLIHQVESEHIKPNTDLARKLEKALHIKIVEEVKEEEEQPSKVNLSSRPVKHDDTVTFGDFIKKR
jgi:putative transcription factor